MDRVQGLIELLDEKLAPLSRRPDIARVRQKGLMVGLDLQDAEGKPLDPVLRTGHQVCMEAREHGVILRPLGDTVVMMPPLCMSTDQVQRVVSVFEEVLDGR